MFCEPFRSNSSLLTCSPFLFIIEQILGVSGFFAENSFQGIPYSISAETNLVEVALLNNRTLQKKLFWRYPDIAVKFLHTLCSELEEQLRSSFLDNIL